MLVTLEVPRQSRSYLFQSDVGVLIRANDANRATEAIVLLDDTVTC